MIVINTTTEIAPAFLTTFLGKWFLFRESAETLLQLVTIAEVRADNVLIETILVT